jgi:hypothetical protein
MTIIRPGMSRSDCAENRRAWAFGADGGALACLPSAENFQSRAATESHFAFGLD